MKRELFFVVESNIWMNLSWILCREAVVISVKDLSGNVWIDKDNNWVCDDRMNHKAERLPNPVSYFIHFLASVGTLYKLQS